MVDFTSLEAAGYRTIAFSGSAERAGAEYQVGGARCCLGGKRKLTMSSSFSPDGAKVVFASNRPEMFEIVCLSNG